MEPVLGILEPRNLVVRHTAQLENFPLRLGALTRNVARFSNQFGFATLGFIDGKTVGIVVVIVVRLLGRLLLLLQCFPGFVEIAAVQNVQTVGFLNFTFQFIRRRLDWHTGTMKRKREQNVLALEHLVRGTEIGFRERERVAQVQASVHIRVGEIAEIGFFGRIGGRFKGFLRRPLLLHFVLHVTHAVPTFDFTGNIVTLFGRL
mmetsp:Transcript_5415/g.8527  ORF Transcript_5415/g.8527 Transcript_5415/m.8527 type:complete len:204 (-) Transcript_5415:215-826(-)